MTTGIMCAIPEESRLIYDEIRERQIFKVGKREFVRGTFDNKPVVFCLSGMGKVSAAVTATILIEKFHADEIVFTGVAGGGPETNIGDIVVGHSYLQHDIDLRPLYSQFYVDSLDTQVLYATDDQVSRMMAAASQFLKTEISFPEFGILQPKVVKGTILSGDQFICSAQRHQTIVHAANEFLPTQFYAMEMEGAAVAQACKELNTPFIVVRAISDKANQKASFDFYAFAKQVASQYAFGVLKEYFLVGLHTDCCRV